MDEARILGAIAIIVSVAPLAGIVLVYGRMNIVVKSSEIPLTLTLLKNLEITGKIRKNTLVSKDGYVVLQPNRSNTIDLLVRDKR